MRGKGEKHIRDGVASNTINNTSNSNLEKMLVIPRDILRVRGIIFFFREIAYLSFRGVNERIYIKRRGKKKEFLVKRSMRMWKIIRIRSGGYPPEFPIRHKWFLSLLRPVPSCPDVSPISESFQVSTTNEPGFARNCCPSQNLNASPSTVNYRRVLKSA